MEYLKLLGILLIIIGFALKWDSAAVVVVSAIITGFLSGMDVVKLLETIGNSFVANRSVTVFVLTLPMIGLIESHGLKQVAVNAIAKLKKMTPSKILNVYLAARELGGVFGISLQGQVQFFRPLISPMVSAAAKLQKKEELTDLEKDLIKGRSAATDNLGNFFAQNLFMGSGGVLLIASTMKSLKYNVTPSQVVQFSIPIAIVTLIVVAVYNIIFDKKFVKKRGDK